MREDLEKFGEERPQKGCVGAEEVEDGREDGSVLQHVGFQWKDSDERGEHLFEGKCGSVAHEHARHGSGSVVARVELRGGRVFRSFEKRLEAAEDVHVLSREVDIGVLDEGADGKRGIALYLGVPHHSPRGRGGP